MGHIEFSTGSEFLAAYWGFLENGGLVLPTQEGRVGETYPLSIRISSSKTTLSVMCTIVKQDSARTVIRFANAADADRLLSRAWSEAEKVPERRMPRRRIKGAAKVTGSTQAVVKVDLIDVSETGCCFRLPEAKHEEFEVGSLVELAADSMQRRARVVWARSRERGVEFC